MKIALIVDKLDDNLSGIGDYQNNLIKSLLKNDVNNDYYLIHSRKLNEKDNYSELFNMNNELFFCKISFPNYFLEKLINKRLFLPNILRIEKFDLVHEMSHILPSPYVNNLKVITVYDLYYLSKNYGFHKYHSFDLKITPRLANLYYLQYYLKKNKLNIITISNHAKNEISRVYGIPLERIYVIYPGIDQEVFYNFKSINPSDNKYLNESKKNFKIILYVGSEQPRKNFIHLLKAFYLLKKRIQNIVLIKVGEPQWAGAREIAYKTIESLGLKNDIIFTGKVNQIELTKLYNIADLFVFPSLYEGFGMPVLEAMACGCPVIASNSTSLIEVVNNAGIMVNPTDISELSDAMHSMLNDDNLRELMINKGFENVKRFSWETSAKCLIKLYDKLHNE